MSAALVEALSDDAAEIMLRGMMALVSRVYLRWGLPIAALLDMTLGDLLLLGFGEVVA